MDVTGGWMKLYNEELCGLYFSSDNIWIIKSGRTRWAANIALIVKKRHVYIVLVKKPEGKKRLGRPRRRWEDNLKMDLKVVRWEGIN
jgi:hypothetical protein